MGFLEDIVASTNRRIDEAKAKVTEEALEQRLSSRPVPRDLAGALQADDVSVIAEIKRATPAKGVLDLTLDAGKTAAAYAEGGAAAISVLTEPDLFKGSLEDLERATTVGLPVLRKDFIVDPYQLLEARASGADAVLLIVRILDHPSLGSLLRLTRSLGMEALVEVHTDEEMDRALDVGANVIGVNHRDLDSFEVDPDRTKKLAPLVPAGVVLVALSGVSTRREVEELGAAGARAVLVGESLVTSSDPVVKLRELLGHVAP
jgi:indole-3-glycerol phosphate synthase